MLLLLQTIIYGSLLILWFLISYIVFDWMDLGDVNVDSKSPVEDVVASLANYDNSKFLKGLSRTYSRKSSIIGAIDVLDRLPDGRLRMAGWAIDKAEAGPISVFLIIPTKGVLVAGTGKRRDDVWTALRLTKDFDSSGFDDVFEFKFDCKYSEQSPFVVAVNQKNQFAEVALRKKVSGCDDTGAN